MYSMNMKVLVFGIQGGIGSFNEEAILYYLIKNKIRKYKIKYLYTTKRVLSELNKGNIDYGIFALQNSVGGVVDESIRAMAGYKFQIVKEFAIPIKHFLMRLENVEDKKINKIMAHPQVLKQCKDTLQSKYSDYKLKSGKGDLVDTAKLAEALVKGKIKKETYILGPKSLSDMYLLKIVDKNLQDDDTNETSFLLVEK